MGLGDQSRHDPKVSYYRARYYDPASGRFVSEDPVRFSAGMDFYSYLNNSVPNFSDPTGEFPTWWHYSKTYQLAKKVFGPKCEAKAKAVANADKGVDATPGVWNTILFGLGQGSGWEYGGPHFPASDIQYIVPLENAIKTCDLNLLGKGLHTLQDSFSHWSGPLGPVLHYISGPAMDYGALINDNRAGGAAISTESWLAEFKDACLECCE